MQCRVLALPHFVFNIRGAMSTKTEPEYRLPLPSPLLAKALTTGIGEAVSPKINTSLADLAAANSSGNADEITGAAEAVLSRFEFSGKWNGDDDAAGIAAKEAAPRFTIYDLYFEVERLPDTATKENTLAALTVALAVVMKDVARTESAPTAISPVEFGILRQALATVVEVLSETNTAHD